MIEDQNESCSESVPKPGLRPSIDGVPLLRAQKVFQNDLALARISKFMDAKELLSLRSTCPTWNRNFVPELKKKHTPIKLAVHERPYGVSRESKYLLKEYIQLVKSNFNIPFSRYEIYDVTADYTDCIEFMIVCASTTKCLSLGTHAGCGDERPGVSMGMLRATIFKVEPTPSGNLTELELRTSYTEEAPIISADENGDREAYPFVKAVPNLKKLKFSTSGFHSEEYDHLLPDVFQNATNLESLSVEDGDEDTKATRISRVLRVLKDTPRANSGFGSLKSLELDALDLNALEEQLSEMSHRTPIPLRLTSFKVTLDYCDSDFGLIENPLRNFLASQASSLKKLQLNICQADDIEKEPDTKRTSPIKFPKLDHLHTFMFMVSAHRADSWELPLHVYEKNTLANNFPNLKTLWYRNYLGEAAPAAAGAEITQLAHGGVVELLLNEKFFQVPATAADLAAAFPSVKCLYVLVDGVGAPEFRTFWTIWLEQTTLELYFTEAENLNLDELLTGIPASKLEDIKTELDEGKLTLAKAKGLLVKYKTGPCLADLVSLQKFKLHVKGLFKLTNVGGYLGLATASGQLQHMDIDLNVKRGCPIQEKLSKECVDFIPINFGLCFRLDYSMQTAASSGLLDFIEDMKMDPDYLRMLDELQMDPNEDAEITDNVLQRLKDSM